MTDSASSFDYRTLLTEASGSESALAAFLQALISKAAEKTSASPDSHPLITLNALKNLLSDRRNDPPQSILSWAVKRVEGFSDASGPRIGSDRLKKNEMPGTLFISDLEEAIKSGDRASMLTLAGYWFLASASPESLLNVFLQHLCPGGSGWTELLYAAHRSAGFCRSGDILWKIILTLIQMIPAQGLPHRRQATSAPVPETLIEVILNDGNPELITRVAVLVRLWELENPRQTLIRKALGPELKALENDFLSAMPLEPIEHEELAGELDYLDLARELVENSTFTDDQIDSGIRVLEALRFLIPRVKQNKLPPVNWVLNQRKETP
ncbi:MAG: hypothetical protein ACE5D1_00295 [Fidelibacterota bacterium]